MTNSHDYRYCWRFTARALCLFDGEKIVGELVKLKGGEWTLFNSRFARCAGTTAPRSLEDLVRWAEGQLWAVGVLPDAPSIDRFAVGGGQNG